MVNPEFEIRRSVLVGDTADVYLQRSQTILRNEGVNPSVVIEFRPERDGLLCGVTEVQSLLSRILPDKGSEVWAVAEGEKVSAKEVSLRVTAPYGSIGIYEPAICGILASCTGWATGANQCVQAAGEIPVLALGARHVHPNVAANLDYASVIGGCVSCTTVQGARLAGVTPAGNMPHSLVLLMDDTVVALEAFDRHMPQEVPRVALVDTFKDEAEESINVAQALREKLRGVRLDTPEERGGVTPDLVREVRLRLDQNDFKHVEIMVSGGFTPVRIQDFLQKQVPVDSFGVGAYIACSSPNPFTADIREIDGRPVAKRGRTPGPTQNDRLDRIM